MNKLFCPICDYTIINLINEESVKHFGACRTCTNYFGTVINFSDKSSIPDLESYLYKRNNEKISYLPIIKFE